VGVDSVYIQVDAVYMARGTTTRARLVATARAYLDENGLEGLTLREIARRAGVSHGAPLRHFDSLAALCSAVAAQGFGDLHEEVAAAMAVGPDDPSARLRAAGHGYVRFAVANPGPYSLMFRADRNDMSDPELAAASTAAFAQLLTAVAAAQAQGWRPDAHTADLAGVIWATVHGLATLTIQGALPGVVAHNGGDPDLTHLTSLAQDLLGAGSTTALPTGGTP
jgi:AcrR family transcriptional regulator